MDNSFFYPASPLLIDKSLAIEQDIKGELPLSEIQ